MFDSIRFYSILFLLKVVDDDELKSKQTNKQTGNSTKLKPFRWVLVVVGAPKSINRSNKYKNDTILLDAKNLQTFPFVSSWLNIDKTLRLSDPIGLEQAQATTTRIMIDDWSLHRLKSTHHRRSARERRPETEVDAETGTGHKVGASDLCATTNNNIGSIAVSLGRLFELL